MDQIHCVLIYVYLYYKITIVVCLSVCQSVCPLLGKLKWNVESKFVFAKMFVSLYLWC